MDGYSKMTYLDGDFEVSEPRDDGYTEITSHGEPVMVATSKLGELFMTLANVIGVEEAESMIREVFQ